jgi:hypothetical protein
MVRPSSLIDAIPPRGRPRSADDRRKRPERPILPRRGHIAADSREVAARPRAQPDLRVPRRRAPPHPDRPNLGDGIRRIVELHVWNFADFRTAQGVSRMGGFNLKGVFTRDAGPSSPRTSSGRNGRAFPGIPTLAGPPPIRVRLVRIVDRLYQRTFLETDADRVALLFNRKAP